MSRSNGFQLDEETLSPQRNQAIRPLQKAVIGDRATLRFSALRYSLAALQFVDLMALCESREPPSGYIKLGQSAEFDCQ